MTEHAPGGFRDHSAPAREASGALTPDMLPTSQAWRRDPAGRGETLSMRLTAGHRHVLEVLAARRGVAGWSTYARSLLQRAMANEIADLGLAGGVLSDNSE